MDQIEKIKNLTFHSFRGFLAFIAAFSLIWPNTAFAQTAYFVDGFHGGIWGHYPLGYTSYITDQIKKHPDWRVNLEVEPETWDRVEKLDKNAYADLQVLLADQSPERKVEYVNPAYGQSYMFNISGESVISQFAYGIKTLKRHFPAISFTTYSSEEPCFTSALPQILTSFGFKYASLKNPNTCWGGYTRAFGKGLINWIGPDGTKILAVPRYEFEALKPGSTWETIANANSKDYIDAAFKSGTEAPVGMALQDAGWKFGPWLKGDYYKPTQYTTWTSYFENANPNHAKATDWKFSQEDVQVGLVWGAQVLQRIAQAVRVSENKIVQAEKIASFQSIDKKIPYPSDVFEKAWQPLLLSQHHDCWIVPYNGQPGDTWADKVNTWTAFTDSKSDSVIFSESNLKIEAPALKVYNTTLYDRKEWIAAKLPKGWDLAKTVVLNQSGEELPTQTDAENKTLIFKGNVPAAGYAFFKLKKKNQTVFAGANIEKLADGDYKMETDFYRLIFDPKKGGTITSLKAKHLGNREFVDANSKFAFNSLRGNFFKKGGFKNSAETPATIEILENNSAKISLAVKGEIAGESYTQTITLTQGEKRIDFKVNIDWKEKEGIGAFEETNYQSTARRKAFYNDQYKLLTLFPLNLNGQKVFKNAPFDVTESKLKNTFYSTWDSIKNNVILNWVDVVDQNKEFGCALYTDHTTSYAHGEDFPLGLTTQYIGKGLWGRDYRTEGATEINYVLIPHAGNWKDAELWKESSRIDEPLRAIVVADNFKNVDKSFLKTDAKGWVLSSIVLDGKDLLVRIFNAEGTDAPAKLLFGFQPTAVIVEQLNGLKREKLPLRSSKNGSATSISIPPFGFKNIRLSGISQ